MWHVDPLHCPHGWGPLEIVSFMDPCQRDAIDLFLTHARVPPAAPPLRELTYVGDLEPVADPGPVEPVRPGD